MAIGAIIAGIAIGIGAIALYAALKLAREDADCNFSRQPVGSPVVGCPAAGVAVISKKEADALFEKLKRTDIPYDYPPDCCYARAHEMCRIIEAAGIACKKYWLYDEHWGEKGMAPSLSPKNADGSLVTFPDRDGNRTPVKWFYHVAPTINVRQEDGSVQEMVMDPSIAPGPVTKEQWRKIQGDPSGAYAEESDSKAYFQNQKQRMPREEDPDFTKTAESFDGHRISRDIALRREASKKAIIP